MSLLLSVAALLVGFAGSAQISITNGSTYSQDFNTLSATTSGTAVTWTNNSTIAGWYLFRQPAGAPVALASYLGDAGSSTTGSYFSFGTPSGNTDRALGSLGSGGAYFGSPSTGAVAAWMAVALTNASGTTINSVTVGFDGEQWRNNGNATAQTMVLQYGFGASFGAVTTWNTPGGTFDWTSPVASITAAVVNGNVAGKVAGRGGSLSSLGWANGTVLWIRWVETNDASNDHALAIDDFSFTATIPTAPEIDLKQAGNSISSGGTKDLGSSVVGSPSTTTFTIENTGNANLAVSSIAVTNGSSDFTVDLTSFSSPVSGPGSTSFDVIFTPSSATPNISAEITITNTDGDEGSYILNVTGTGTAAAIAEINLKVTGGADITSGSGSYPFASQPYGTSSSPASFTIENLGTANLDLTGTPIIELLSGDVSEFSVTQATTPVSGPGNTLFTVTFSPTTAGPKSAIIQILNSDADEGTYTFTVTGTGTIPIPANDLCANASTLTIDAAASSGTLVGSGFASPFTSGNDVWYKITPAATGFYGITVTGFSGNVDIQLFGACPSSTTFLNHSAKTTGTSEIMTQYLTGASVYLVRVLASNVSANSSTFSVQATTVTDFATFSSLGTTYSQDFNTLDTSGTSSITPEGWHLAESGTGANFMYTGGTGGSNSGDSYSFGAVANAERGFGTLLSGSVTPFIGVKFKNNTGATITSLNISYTGEQWRLGQASRTGTAPDRDRLDFQYSTTATALGTGTYADVDGLDFIEPVFTGTVGGLNGNAGANKVSVASAITGLSLADGATIWIRWSDFNATGSDDGLAIDDFSITPCVDLALFTVTGGGSTCSPSGVAIGLSGSETGVSYQLSRANGGTPVVVSTVPGTGLAMSFGNQNITDVYTVLANRTGGCAASLAMTGSANVAVSNTNTFNAGLGNWSAGSNWSCGIAPLPTHDVVIASGGHVTLDIPTFTVAGSLNMNATSSLTIGAGNVMSVTGSADFNNQSVVLVSNASGTASIGNSSAIIANATAVTVQRYFFSTQRAWRIVTIPLTGGQTIRGGWAAGQAPITDLSQLVAQPTNNGTLLTGHALTSGATATALGMDWWPAISNTASGIRNFDAGSSGWPSKPVNNNVPGKTLTAARADQAYMLFVRGDRQQAVGATAGHTTLRPTGTLIQGPQSITVPATPAFTVFGNPYASSVDFESIYQNNSGKLAHQFRRWDANNGANGGYVTVKYLGGSYTTVPPDDAATDLSHIQSGQGVLLEPATGGTVNISESDKVVSSSLPQVFDDVPLALFRANLNQDNGAGSLKQVDGVLIAFSSNYTTGLDADDVTKVNNFTENISIAQLSGTYTIAALPLISNNDEIKLNVGGLTTRKYALVFKGQQMQEGFNAYIKDNFLEKETPISTVTNELTVYNFDATADAASKAADRFSIVFRTGTLPLSLTSARAFQAGSGVQVEWKAVNERSLSSYEVQKSANGNSFTKATTVAAQNAAAATYNWVDATPAKGNNFYRIKATGTDGSVSYSQVLLVNLNGGKAGFTMYPNPVKGRNIGVQFSNMEKGQYSLNVFNSAGQKILSRSINHQGGSASEEINLGNAMASGVYRVSLVSNDGSSQNQTLVLQ